MSYLTPEDILNKVASFQSYEPVKVRGKIIATENGFFKLTHNNHRVDLILSNGKIPPLNQLVEVEGLIRCFPHPSGGVYPRVEVRKLQIIEDTEEIEKVELQNLEKELLDIIRKRSRAIQKLYSAVLSLLSTKNKIRISLIHGKDAQTHRDFVQGLSESFPAYREVLELSFTETSLVTDQSLSECIKKASDVSDLVFIIRGGGRTEEFQSIGGPATLRAIAECRKPVYVALGHTLDRNVSLIEKVADEHFATPTLAGVELGKAIMTALTIRDYEMRKDQIIRKEAELKNSEREMEDLRKKISDLTSQRNILIGILIIVLVVLASTLLLK